MQKRILSPALLIACVGMSVYHMATAYFGAPAAEAYYPTHLLFALSVLYLDAACKHEGPRRWLKVGIDLSIVAATMAATGYLILNADYLANRFVYAEPLTTVEMTLGIALIAIILDAARRTVGWVLVWVTLAFLAYAALGQHLPGPFYHRGFGVERIVEQTYMTPDGIWNVPVAVTANFIFLFVLLGALLLASGAGAFFTDAARALTGRMTGGPAKTAVVSSAFMGMLSGSSPANVVTTGSFTIPAMKQVGYKPTFAAGVEAVASSGGQLTPPIMGSAAFLMVEFAGVSYTEIITLAAIPALLYFVALLAMTDLEARRLGLAGEAGSDVPSLRKTMSRRLYLLGPVGLMLWLLIDGYTPTASGFWAIVSLTGLLVVFDGEARRRIHRILLEAAVSAPKIITAVTVASAVGGILAGIILMTGLGVKMSEVILDASGGFALAALFMTMIVSVILGMGLPTASGYIILATLLAPGLVKMGVPLAAAHLFIIYCAAKSSITPPVAVSSYAAAAISGTDPWRTSLVAFKLGISGFIIPYMFVFNPELLGEGAWWEVLWAACTAGVGVIMLSVAAIGWLAAPLPWWSRLAALASAFLLIAAEPATDAAGIILAGAVLAVGRFGRRAKSAAAGQRDQRTTRET